MVTSKASYNLMSEIGCLYNILGMYIKYLYDHYICTEYIFNLGLGLLLLLLLH